MGNKGGDAAMAAVEMAGLYAELKRNRTPDA
jgi:6,7-dimethyl-8-ribityllumazine synthase